MLCGMSECAWRAGGRALRWLAALGLVAAHATGVSAAPPTAQVAQLLARAQQDCAGEQGRFQATPRAVTRRPLSPKGPVAQVVDASQFSCSTAASLYGGSGGTYLWVVVADQVHELLAHQWQWVTLKGRPVLLLAVHHSQCGPPAAACYRAVSFEADGRMHTVQ